MTLLMTANALSLLFVLVLMTNAAVRLWLASRQIRHVARHRDAVPAAFEGQISLTSHQRAAAYTIAKVRLQLLDSLVSTVVLVALTLLGGAQWLYDLSAGWLPDSPWLAQLVFLLMTVALLGLIDVPFSWYRQFRLEKRFGFNRMTPQLFLADLFKGALIGTLIATPLIGLVLWLMQSAGAWWWLATWVVWTAFSIALMVLYPTVIAPRFNKFKPLPQDELRTRVEALLARCGFRSQGLFVFFDTLLERLDGDQIEAVLAHELGHFKHKHIAKRLVISFATSFLGLALLGWLAAKPWFYTGLGMTPGAIGFEGPALLLFLLVIPVFTFLLRPLTATLSRRDEFQADAFAASQTQATHLVNALLRLYQDNASTLTPDPLHSAFYDSHPSASERIGRLLQANQAQPA